MIAPTLETVSGGELMSRRQVVYWLVGTILALIALGGLVLWWPPGAPANSSNLLGTALLGATIVALALLVCEYLLSTQMREIDTNNFVAAQERTLRREEAEEVLERQRTERIEKWILQFMASFQQDLRHIDLSGREMSGLYLGACNLLRANLKGTNLDGANLSGTNLTRADLSGVKLSGASYDFRTIWPEGFEPQQPTR